jgi:hypothetical protein
MQILPLSAIPNQKLSSLLDGNQWDISVKLVNGAIAVSLTMNGVDVVDNARAVAGMRIIQSLYQQDGNFAIISNNQGVPDYTQFGVSQFLVYISIAELAVSQSPPAAQVPVSYFDPIALLPLRFAPQNYVLISG